MKLDKRLLLLARSSWGWIVLSIGLGLAGGAIALGQAALVSQAAAAILLEEKPPSSLTGLLGGLLVIFLLRAAATYGMEESGNAAARQVKVRLRDRLLRHIHALGPAYARDQRTGELTNTLTEGIEALDAYFSQYLPQLALAVLVPVLCLVFVARVDVLSALILLITGPLIPVFMLLIGSMAEALTQRQWRILGRLSAYLLDVLQGLSTLKLLGNSREQAQVISRLSERHRHTTLEVLRLTFISSLALEWLATLSTAVVAVQIGLRLLYGQVAFTQAFFILLVAPEFYLPLRLLGLRFHAGMSGVSAGKRIFEILEQPSSKSTEGDQVNLQPAASSAPAISFHNVQYTYPGERPALHGISIDLPTGLITALVGPSGSGKSTTAALLLRFIEASSGDIRVNNQSIHQLPVEAWRARVAWVPQKTHLFSGSISDNLRLAHPAASQDEIEKAARLANAHEFILALPDGYQTRLGERGARLSGGQAQRIALARAFLKNAPLLIMDEPTANLDPESEALIADAVRQLQQGRTVLLIAHRLNSAALADQIVVLDNGRAAERGSHAALLGSSQLYRRLVLGEDRENGERQDAIPAPVEDGIGTCPSREAPPVQEQPQLDAEKPLAGLLRLAIPYARQIGLSALLGFATIASGVGLMATSAYLIARAALGTSVAELQVAIVGVRFFGLARGVFRYLERYTSHSASLGLVARLRVWLYQTLEPLAPARLLDLHSGNLLSRAIHDLGWLENFYVRALAPLLVALMLVLSTSVWLASFHPTLGATLLGISLAAGALLPWLALRLARSAARQIPAKRSALSAALVDSIQGMEDLLVFGQASAHADRCLDLGKSLAHSQARLARQNAAQSAVAGLLANLALASTLALGAGLVWQGKMEALWLPVLALAALAAFEGTTPLPQAAQVMESSLEAARRLFGLAELRPEVSEPQDPQPYLPPASLSLRSLSFRYPGEPASSPPALDQVSLELTPGKKVALVGPSGSGKSTLLNLLLRFWDYSEGSIWLGEAELRSFSPDALRKKIGVVTQDTFLFNASLRDNLLIACPRASAGALQRAIGQAQLDELVRHLPQGLDTIIGERGLKLSGGERQRLAIARALLKNPPLLLLDEPTAHLDTLTECQVLRSIRALMAGRSVLLATHRLVEMEAMDEILVIQQGQIVERGQHAKLVEQKGLYQRMWELQRQYLHEN